MRHDELRPAGAQGLCQRADPALMNDGRCAREQQRMRRITADEDIGATQIGVCVGGGFTHQKYGAFLDVSRHFDAFPIEIPRDYW